MLNAKEGQLGSTSWRIKHLKVEETKLILHLQSFFC